VSNDITKKEKRFDILEQSLYLQQVFAETTAFHNFFNHLTLLRLNIHKEEVAAYITKKKR